MSDSMAIMRRTQDMTNRKKQVYAWAMIDWANSSFAIVVMTAFFPAMFKQVWARDLSAIDSTFMLSLFNSASSLAIALLAPILGSIADQGNAKKRFLTVFTLLGVLASGLLPMAGEGQYMLAGCLYALGALGFSGNNTFYDALITDVSEARDFDRVSALGYSLGYLGGGLLFMVNLLMVSQPERFGLSGKGQAVDFAFIMTAAWWAIFTIPALLWIHETPAVPAVGGGGSVLTRGFKQLAETFREIKQLKQVVLYLAAYMLYIDAVNTVIKMAVDYGLSIGLQDKDLMTALLLTQFIGFPAAILFGRLGERWGAKAGITLAILVYMGICGFAYRMTTSREFFVMALVVGLVQGGIQSLSRSYFARLIPAERSGEFFGFYNMLGKFAAVIGPTLMGVTAKLTGNSRMSILSLLLLFGTGLSLLFKVKETRA